MLVNDTSYPSDLHICVITTLRMYLQPWSQRSEKIILFTFCPSPPLRNVDKTLSSNTSLHFTIFQH